MSEMNMKKISEELITAYALGELSEGERISVQAAIDSDPSLKNQIREIQDLATLMKVELAREPEFKLSPDQVDSVLKGKRPPKVSLSWFRGLLTPKALGIEAALAALLVALIYVPNPRNSSETLISSLFSKKVDSTTMTTGVVGIGANLDGAISVVGDSHHTIAGPSSAGNGYPASAAMMRFSGDASKKSLRSAKGGMSGFPSMASEGRSVSPGTSVPDREHNTEAYDRIEDNPFLQVGQNPLSTFSIDVDTASYANMRRYIASGVLPPKDAVRIEEMVNYFSYSYPQPTGDDPFSVNTEVAVAPWNSKHRLMKIGLKGRVMDEKKRPQTNLVFLVDVSGSMQDENKLPLLKQAFKLLVEKLDHRDKVSLVTYASGTQVVLPPTSGDQKDTILVALDRLVAGGSTNGEGGIQLAYKAAQEAFIKGGSNRVILATDGDFNVGASSQGELTRMIEEKAKSGVFLSVLGFGMGNYKDSTLESLSSKGNGNYAYIDSIAEAKKVLVDQIGGTLFTIAKDVKLQLEFNPNEVSAYRLIGYENRLLRAEDFNNDKKDAGDIGAGHTVTAIYEIVPKGVSIDAGSVDTLKYQPKPKGAEKPIASAPQSATSFSGELLTVKLRYKKPDADVSQLISHVVKDDSKKIETATSDFRWAASVAGFGMLLRNSEYKGDTNYPLILDLAEGSKGEDVGGYRGEFIQLIQKARSLSQPTASPAPVR